MFDYIFENMFQEISNVTVLNVAACDSRSERAKKSADCADRFLNAAFTFSKKEYLGWELEMKGEKSSACRVFSSPNTEISEADFQWIFKAGTSEARDMGLPSETSGTQDMNLLSETSGTQDMNLLSETSGTQDMNLLSETSGTQDMNLLSGDYFRQGRNIYALCLKQEEKWESGNEHDGQKCNSSMSAETCSMEKLECLVDTMKEVNDVYLRILAFGDAAHSHAGIILLSLPKKLSLRLKVAVLSAFPGTEMKEWKGNSEDTMNILPLSHIKRSIEGLLQILMAHNNAQKMMPPENILGDLEDSILPGDMKSPEEEKSCSEIVLTGGAGIEELGLSIRSYQCLNRAGIDTVEELQTMSDEELMKIRNLGRNGIIEIKKKLASFKALKKGLVLTAENYRAMLDELIGLKEVKEQVKKIAAYAELKQDMLLAGAADIPLALNMEFVGNPGTAKTTVARILAGIFHEIGLLAAGDMVEVGRADLIGRYAGHTADNVKNVFKSAKGKLLFIDEAYSLVEHWEGGYGDEAIDTIVQEMENHRDETVVIFAGYPKKMEEFFLRNPGLRSRVPFKITFCDYSAEEMEEIVKLEAKKRGFSIQEEAGPRLSELCRNIAQNADAGNGRFCRNLVENAILEYAVRIYGGDDRKSRGDFVLTASDFARCAFLQTGEKTQPVGFQAS